MNPENLEIYNAELGNDPELDGKYLGTVTKDFVKVAKVLKEASYQMRSRGFEYPIFPVAKYNIPIGELLFSGQDLGLEWNYYVSYRDIFVQNKLITKPNKFESAYKDPEEFCCLFVVDEPYSSFMFVPYPEEDN